jgi:dienelactone hydrolase
MRTSLTLAGVAALVACQAHAGFFDGPELTTMADFKDGKFQVQSVKHIHWNEISQQGRSAAERVDKVWVPATLFMPEGARGKVPAMVIVHGIGGAFDVNGRKRVYWEYAEDLAKNGVAAVVVDTHGARGLGKTSQEGSAAVSVHTFVADAFAVADLLRSHPGIDARRIGIMGFSKGGSTALLAEDERFVRALSRNGQAFRLHIPIYPGCQVYPESVRPTGAPVLMLLGSNDIATGIKGCFEIEQKLKRAGVPVRTIVYEGAYHGWDEDIRPIPFNDVSTEDCRYILKDGGGIAEGRPDGPLLDTAAKGADYWRRCTKGVTTFVGRDDRAYREGKRAVLDMVKAAFDESAQIPQSKPAGTMPAATLEEQLERIRLEQETEAANAAK